MAVTLSQTISMDRIATPGSLTMLIRSFNGLPNNPASLYLSTNSHSLIVYVAPLYTVNVISLPYLVRALRQGEESAAALKGFLETSAATKVFFDARMAAKVLFEDCGIKLATPICTERAHIHEVQMMELALRREGTDREWLAGLDRCIARDSTLDIDVLKPGGPDRNREFDERILHLPVLWKKYHDRLIEDRKGAGGGSFWVALIREATQKRLAVSRGENHRGYSIDSAKSAWDKESIDDEMDLWNDDCMDLLTHDAHLGAEHWAKFDIL